MLDYQLGDRVQVSNSDLPAWVMEYAGQEGTVVEVGYDGVFPLLVQFPNGRQVPFRREEVEPVGMEEHQTISRDELEERFVRQRNTIAKLQARVRELEQGGADKKLSVEEEYAKVPSVTITNELAQVTVSIVDGRLVVQMHGAATIDWSNE